MRTLYSGKLKAHGPMIYSLINNTLFGQVLETYSSRDCRKLYECQGDGTFKEKDMAACHKKAACETRDGERRCFCKLGYKGDGINTCTGRLCRN